MHTGKPFQVIFYFAALSVVLLSDLKRFFFLLQHFFLFLEIKIHVNDEKMYINKMVKPEKCHSEDTQFFASYSKLKVIILCFHFKPLTFFFWQLPQISK